MHSIVLSLIIEQCINFTIPIIVCFFFRPSTWDWSDAINLVKMMMIVEYIMNHPLHFYIISPSLLQPSETGNQATTTWHFLDYFKLYVSNLRGLVVH